MLNEITAVCVDTRDPNLALLAAERMAASGVARVIIMTDAAGAEFIRARDRYGVEIVLIPTLGSVAQYSRFILHGLGDFITAEHFLVFQWDGFIRDPRLWWEGFLDYDFIGAPWPESLASPEALVGNGGFSLRSGRLLRALSKLDLPTDLTFEDRFIADHAEALIEFGDIVIAPPEIARHFAVEHRPPYPMADAGRLVARGGAFGFHGWFNFPLVFNDAGLPDYIDGHMTPSQRFRILKSLSNNWLMAYLNSAQRFDCLMEAAARTETTLGVALDRSDPDYLQNLVDLMLAD